MISQNQLISERITCVICKCSFKLNKCLYWSSNAEQWQQTSILLCWNWWAILAAVTVCGQHTDHRSVVGRDPEATITRTGREGGRADGQTAPNRRWLTRSKNTSTHHRFLSPCYHVSYQNRWPHMLITASLAVSKQMLHSKVARSRSRSLSPLPPLLLPPPGPSRSLLLSPAGNPPLLAGPPSLEYRESAAAITFNELVEIRVKHRGNPPRAGPT